jgi:hypothetical protein
VSTSRLRARLDRLERSRSTAVADPLGFNIDLTLAKSLRDDDDRMYWLGHDLDTKKPMSVDESEWKSLISSDDMPISRPRRATGASCATVIARTRDHDRHRSCGCAPATGAQPGGGFVQPDHSAAEALKPIRKTSHGQSAN